MKNLNLAACLKKEKNSQMLKVLFLPLKAPLLKHAPKEAH